MNERMTDAQPLSNKSSKRIEELENNLAKKNKQLSIAHDTITNLTALLDYERNKV